MPRLWPALKRTVAEFRDDDLTDWAAALTYYGLLSLFPGLIALVSIAGPIESIASDQGPRALPSSSAGRWRSGRPRATSAPSSAPPT